MTASQIQRRRRRCPAPPSALLPFLAAAALASLPVLPSSAEGDSDVGVPSSPADGPSQGSLTCKSVCRDGSFPPPSHLKLHPGGGLDPSFTCEDAVDLASGLADVGCLSNFYIGEKSCGCSPSRGSAGGDGDGGQGSDFCDLCEDGSVLPDFFRRGVPPYTCLTEAGLAYQLSPEDDECAALRAVSGVYCGCENPASSRGACRVCGDDGVRDLLPKPDLVVEHPTYGPFSCAGIEINANFGTEGFDCDDVRANSGVLCCAGMVDVVDNPGAEPDWCAGTGNDKAAESCTTANCLCRLKGLRDEVLSGRMGIGSTAATVEEGCFRTQRCPQLGDDLEITEEIKCRLHSAAGKMTNGNRGKEDGNIFHSGDSDGGGGGGGIIGGMARDEEEIIVSFPPGLRPGTEVAARYTAMGKDGLVMGMGIGCDGYLYLLGQADGDGDDDESSSQYACSLEDEGDGGLCARSCPDCRLCSTAENDPNYDGKEGTARGFNWRIGSFLPARDFLDGTVPMVSGDVYSWGDDGGVRCGQSGQGQDTFLCHGTWASRMMLASCAIASRFEELGGGASEIRGTDKGDVGVEEKKLSSAAFSVHTYQTKTPLTTSMAILLVYFLR